MTRIAYFVHGRGKGHAVRTEAVLRRIVGQHELRLFCSGAAFDILGGFPMVERVRASMPGKGMVRAFASRFVSDRDRFRDWRPDLVVSDGDGPSVHAAKSLGLPVLAIGHGLIFRHADLSGANLPTLKRLREQINAASSSWPAERRVAVHFAPVAPRTRGTRVARPDLPERLRSAPARDDFFLAYFRDDDGLPALEALRRRGHRVVLFGRPASIATGVEVHAPDVDGFADALSRCRAVVGSAGNHLPAECAMLGLPLLAFYRQGDAEQEMNARLIEAAGIGLGSSLDQCTPALIERFEAELDRPRHELMAHTLAMPAASEIIPESIAELTL